MREYVRPALAWLTWGLLALVLVSVVAGQLFGQPMGLAYVESGSMAPTLERGDAFVAVPAAVAGPVGPGDVVVFRAKVLEDGGLTTHRIVGETTGGYVTRGDANIATDQDSGEPPVAEGRILAQVWTVGGHVVAIPKLGLVAIAGRELAGALGAWLGPSIGALVPLGTQGAALGLFAVGAGAYAVATWYAEDRQRRRYVRTRRRTAVVDVRWLVAALALGVAVFATASMAVPLGAQEFELISTENGAPGTRIVKAGTSENLTYTVPGGGLLPAVVVLEPASDGLAVEPDRLYVPGGEIRNATVTVTAPPETGIYPQYLREHRYLAVLPTGLILRLYGVHPWLPILVIDALLAGGFVLLGLAWLGGGQLRIRPRTARLSALDRLRGWWVSIRQAQTSNQESMSPRRGE